MTFIIGALTILCIIGVAIALLAAILTVVYVFLANDNAPGLIALVVIVVAVALFAHPIGQMVRPWLASVLR